MYFKKLNRGLKITTLGWQLIILIFSTGVIGIFTGINAMFLFLGVSLGFFIISGVISEKYIKNTKVLFNSRECYYYAFENSLFLFQLQNNSSQSFYGLVVLFSIKNPLTNKQITPLAQKNIVHLKPMTEEVFEMYSSKFRRGFYNKVFVTQETTFPFGIFKKYAVKELKTQIYVLPQKLEKLKSKWSKVVESFFKNFDGDEDFVHHVKYDNSTPKNRIDWKKNSRLIFENWVAKKINSNKKEKKVCINSLVFDYKKLSANDFEMLLSNIMTGVDILEKKGVDVSLNLNSLGYYEDSNQIKKSLAMLQKNAVKKQASNNLGFQIYVSINDVVI